MLCEQNKQLIWLGNAEIIPLTKHTVLLGQDGWADARYGDFNHSPVRLNDSRLIAELFQAALLNQSELKKSMQQLADSDAKKLEKTLNQSSSPTTKNLIIATHVPPFAESCCHQGKQSDQNWLPYFASKATGDVILNFSKKNPEINMLVLCGHTHSSALFSPHKNLTVKAGMAEYYKPALQEIMVIE